jgi:hypothetical protein
VSVFAELRGSSTFCEVNAIEVRRAAEDDASGIAEIHVLSWQAADRGVARRPLFVKA